MPTKLAAPQYGLHRKATRAPPWSATLHYGEPPTASIPKIHDQPEELSSKCFRPCGNNAWTGISRVPPTRPQVRGPTGHTQDAPHSVQGTSGSARTNNPNGVPAGHPRPADSTPQSSNRGAQNMRLHSARWQDRQQLASDRQHTAESGSFFRIKASLRSAWRRVSSLRCGPCAGLLWTGRRHAGAPSGGCSSTRGLYSTSWMRPSKVRCSIISRATSG